MHFGTTILTTWEGLRDDLLLYDPEGGPGFNARHFSRSWTKEPTHISLRRKKDSLRCTPSLTKIAYAPATTSRRCCGASGELAVPQGFLCIFPLIYLAECPDVRARDRPDVDVTVVSGCDKQVQLSAEVPPIDGGDRRLVCLPLVHGLQQRDLRHRLVGCARGAGRRHGGRWRCCCLSRLVQSEQSQGRAFSGEGLDAVSS